MPAKAKDQSGKATKRTKQVKDPNRPKRPLSSYMIFVQENRSLFIDQFKSDNGNSQPSVVEITKGLGAKWRDMSEMDKKAYMAKADKLKEEYEIKKQEYESKLATSAA